MRVLSSLKTLILYVIALIMMALPSAHGVAQESAQTLAYRYGYVSLSSQNQNLHLINPEDTTQGEQIIVLPIADDDFIFQMSASPNGQWISFITGPNEGSEGSQIRLFNVLTGEVRDRLFRELFARLSDSRYLAWSPNSRYLAMNVADAEIGVHYSTYIYDIQTDLGNYIALNGASYDLSWSPDSTRLAVATTECSQDSCQGQIEVVSLPDYGILASTYFNTFGNLLCSLVWSPDNRYLSFVFSCLNSGLDDYLHDVFTWDTATQSVQKVTAFTQNLDFTSLQELDPSTLFRTFYDLIWYDASHLLVGVSVGEFKGGIGYDPSTVQVKTYIYQPDGNSTQISNTMLRDWSRNPVNNTVAFRSEEKVLYTDEYNMPQLSNQSVSVQVATLNGNTLQVLHTQPINGCDLNWSPDGVYLAYSQRDLDFSDCFLSLTPIDHFNFLNQVNGQISQTPVSVDPSWSGGWIAVASGSPTEQD